MTSDHAKTADVGMAWDGNLLVPFLLLVKDADATITAGAM